MKFTKIDRDNYVLNNYKQKTNAQLAEVTGWSITTIKSSLTRQSLSRQGKTKRTIEIENYILSNKEKADIEIARELGCKIDKVRDIKKSLGVFKSPSDIAFEFLQNKYTDFILNREDYINNKTPMKVECKTCHHLTHPRPNDLTTFDYTCACCKAIENKNKKLKLKKILQKETSLFSKLKMHSKYREHRVQLAEEHYDKVFKVSIPVFNLIKLECKTCGYKRLTKYSNNLFKKKGSCIKCNAKRLSKEQEFKEECIEHGYTLLSEYGKFVTVSCKHGHIRKSTPYNIRKYGCASCTINGKCYIYLMKLEEGVFKVGISNDPNRRRNEVANSGHLVGLTLERTWEIKEGYSAAREIEGRILANHEKVFGTSGIFDGSTEFIYGDFGQLCEEISSLI